MIRIAVLNPTHPAPLSERGRTDALRKIVAPIRPRRCGYARSGSITITYLHLAEAADASRVAEQVATALDWVDTEVAVVGSGVVAVTTKGT